ncbi:phenylethanolamine N-methyltransferase [Alosa sapidissima]|uniref:phenylethanolamine N-methyltransferase n=1 Tax=Alosa sapidissima TaxID=34773 RepID=UPI001C0A2C9E|nr:phenylethanolamine N-methyltransferase [Alosa sapidissima]
MAGDRDRKTEASMELREERDGKNEEPASREAVEAMRVCYQGFDPAAYLQFNYTPPRADFQRADSIVPWKLTCLHRAFTEGDVRGEVLVDVGSGPTLYQVMSGCEVFGRVVLTDFLEVNRRELQYWLAEGSSSSLDWTPFLQYVCQLEGRKPSESSEKAARLRSVVSDVLPIDVHRSCPLPPDAAVPTGGADCLVSCFCLESASPDVAAFTRALGHITSLLRPGGHLLLIGALGESYYLGAPGLRIPVVPLDEAQVCASLRVSGYQLLQLSIYTLPVDMRVGVDDVTGVFFAKARKL